MSVTDPVIVSFTNHLTETLSDVTYPPTDEVLTQLKSWIDLYGESDESLSSRSKQRKSVRKRAQYFSRRVYDISPDLFVLCALSYTIHNLPRIPPTLYNPLYNRLRQWWEATAPPDFLRAITREYCPELRQIHLNSEARPTEIQRDEEPPTKRQATMPHTSGDTASYLAFSQTRRDMLDNLPEPFRTGIETSKLWAEEKVRGGLSITNCLTLYLPHKVNEDAFLVVRMGYSAGFHVSDTLGLGDPESLERSGLHNNDLFTR